MRVSVSQQEKRLKEHHAGRPDGRRTPEHGQDEASNKGLHQEKQRRVEEDRQGEQRSLQATEL